MTTLSGKNFLWIVMFITSVALLFLHLGVRWVDANHVYAPVLGEEFSGKRTAKYVNSMRAKYKQFVAMEPSALILGTSRAELGYNTQHDFWGDINVYNFAMAGSSVADTYHILSEAISTGLDTGSPIKKVMYSVDYVSFFSAAVARDDIQSFLNKPMLTPIQILLNDIYLGISISALQGAYSTVFDQDKVYNYDFHEGPVPANGVRDPGVWLKKNENVGFRRVLRNDSIRIFRRGIYEENTEIEPFRKGKYGLGAPEEIFQKILKLCVDHDIELTLVISPVHAHRLELLHEYGRWEGFEHWKRMLVNSVSDINQQASQKVVLWDFSGYNRFSMESVPDFDVKKHIHSFWDDEHFTRVVGDRVLATLKTGHALFPKFGVRLQPYNIDAHLRRINRDRIAYLKEHIKDVKHLKIFKKTYLKSDTQ